MNFQRDIIRGFTVIEGIDGAGTSTQKNLLCKALVMQGMKVMDTCEPSPQAIGQLIRKVLKKELVVPPRTLALLFAADRENHVNGPEGIRAHCSDGGIAVSDRYFHSSLAYQGLVCDPEEVRNLNAYFPGPEYLVFIDVDIGESAKRREKRGQDAEIFEEDAFLLRVRKAYHEAIDFEALHNPGTKVLRLDGTMSIENLHRQICTFMGITPIQ